jgi:hypothetical protein
MAALPEPARGNLFLDAVMALSRKERKKNSGAFKNRPRRKWPITSIPLLCTSSIIYPLACIKNIKAEFDTGSAKNAGRRDIKGVRIG